MIFSGRPIDKMKDLSGQQLPAFVGNVKRNARLVQFGLRVYLGHAKIWKIRRFSFSKNKSECHSNFTKQ